MKIFRRKTDKVTSIDLIDLKKEFKENLKKQKKDYQKDIDFLLRENSKLQRIIKNMAEMVDVPFNCKLIKDVQYDNYHIPEEKYILYIYIKGEEYSIVLKELKNKTFNENVYTFKIEDEIAHFEIKVGSMKYIYLIDYKNEKYIFKSR
ncbi:MAG: hypothetical protein MSA15_09490 [Clostridium sp.]|nr:hypothetical protein [Clostridium sp.]